MKQSVISLVGVLILGGCSANNLDISAGMDLLKAGTVTNQEMKSMAHLAAKEYDRKSRVASRGNRYSKRLRRLTRNFHRVGKLRLNYKVYMTNEVNAFAMADGTVRVYKGLMDKMNDGELLFVIGHEIGHVKYEHTKNAYRMAHATLAARKILASKGGTSVALLSKGTAGNLAQKLVNAQFSQSQESEADKNGLYFLRKAHRNQKYAISALKKLAAEGSGGGFLDNLFASHPAPLKRAEDIQAMIKK